MLGANGDTSLWGAILHLSPLPVIPARLNDLLKLHQSFKCSAWPRRQIEKRQGPIGVGGHPIRLGVRYLRQVEWVKWGTGGDVG
jgi:hypothetical protein